MKRLSVAVVPLVISSCAFATDFPQPVPSRYAHTFSIIAYDSTTGQFGAAVQSHWFKIADVIWVEAGVGAVATQAFVEYSYGPLGLAIMKTDKSAKQALDGLLAADPYADFRQVIMIDKSGIAASHTGSKCLAYAGYQIGANCACQASLMKDSAVWGAMAEAFETTSGDLADRMMAALDAGQAAGGDLRGKQSAAMVVVSAKSTGRPWEDKIVDLRVDDSPEPLIELRRLLNIRHGLDHVNEGDKAIAAKNWDKAAEEYAIATRLTAGNPEINFWYAVSLVNAGEVDRSLPLFKEVFTADPNWRIAVQRLVDSDQLPKDPAMIKKIISQ